MYPSSALIALVALLFAGLLIATPPLALLVSPPAGMVPASELREHPRAPPERGVARITRLA